jgi:ABC-type transporter Mla MlaB component
MAFMTENLASSRRVALEGALTVRCAEAVRATLRSALEQEGDIAIDCAEASEADLSFVQLLFAARASAVHRGKTIALAAPVSGVLLDTLTRAGFRAVAEPAIGDTETLWIDGDPA